MPVHIRRLKCRVTVHTGKRDTPVAHKDEGPRQPSMHFALPAPETRGETTQPAPGQTATGQYKSEADPAPAPEVKQTDPRLIADRVYELMTQEIVHARQRGGSGRRG